MSKIIVTGGLGFIGSHIVDALVDEGNEVHVVDWVKNPRPDRVNKKAIIHTVDIQNASALEDIFKGAEYVFHTAALSRVQDALDRPIETSSVNIMGTINVLTVAKKSGVKRVVYCASSSAYGDQKVSPFSEDLPAQPNGPYALQKYVGELACKVWSEVYGLETVRLRYFNVYGPRFDPNDPYGFVIGVFLKQSKEGKPLTIIGDGTQTRDFVFVRDVVRANLLAATNERVGKGEVINIGSGKNITINDLAAIIGGEVTHIPPRLEQQHALGDIRLAKELLGWSPTVSLEEGLKEVKKSYL